MCRHWERRWSARAPSSNDKTATGAYHFDFDGSHLAAYEHAHALTNGLVSSAVVREDEREINWIPGRVEVEIPILICIVFHFVGARCEGFWKLKK